ncbi:MAG TPA: TerC family protein [Thermoanaerobaculia bacterium]|jgi:tellurite resistance protein TerC|nr:TerC family protein [Thermoanaerobaculia bacterium]
MDSIASPMLWTIFSVFVLGMLALDLGVFNRKAHVVRFREALTWSVVWVALSMVFNWWIYRQYGSEKALEFLTGYVIEKALSVDNIFVFVILFASFAVPKIYQHRVLFWGVIGAILMRALFIGLGAALVARFHWVMYVFGAILIITGIRLMFTGGAEPHPEKNPIYKLGRRLVPAVPEYHGKKFFIKLDGRWFATPLFLVLLAIEATDVVFAVDSIPAIFAISDDPFIVYTSNIFAILGLRAMYFLLARVIDKFHLLKIGLAVVLLFVGVKMVIAEWFKIPIGISLAVIGGVLVVSVIASILWPKTVESAALEDSGDEPSGSADPRAAGPR